MDVVVDTNVAVSAAIGPRGASADIVRAWQSRLFTWVTSEALLQEARRAFGYPRVKRYLRRSDAEIAQFLDDLEQHCMVVRPARSLDVMEHDPADNRVLEAALEANADYIATGDDGLLALGEFEGTEIVTPARFVAILSLEQR